MIKKSAIWILAGLLFLISCDNTPVVPPDPTTTSKIVGTLEIEFRVPGSFLPPSRVLRADLSIAKNAEALYKGRFLQTANVYTSPTSSTWHRGFIITRRVSFVLPRAIPVQLPVFRAVN